MKKELDVAAALIKKDTRFLLCQRKEDDRFACLWEFPGGGVEEGETLTEAVEREIKEELGLKIEAKNILKEFYDEDDNLKIRVFLLECFIKGGRPYAKDCRDFGFFSRDEIEKLPLAPVDKKIFNYLLSTNLV